MYIHNTTFIVEHTVKDLFIKWAHEVFIKAALDSKRFETVTMARILTQVDPEADNYAIQMTVKDLDSATEWHDDTAAILKDDLAARLGTGSVMFFTTNMEVIE